MVREGWVGCKKADLTEVGKTNVEKRKWRQGEKAVKVERTKET